MKMGIEKKCYLCGAKGYWEEGPVCLKCQKKASEDLSKAKAFVLKNPEADAEEIAKGTDLPLKLVKCHLRNGRLDPENLFECTDKDQALHLSDMVVGNYVWVEAKGKLDSITAYELQKYINKVTEDGWKHLIVDMGGVSFLSSNGIRVIVVEYKRLHGEGGSFRIANPSNTVKNVLGMVALDSMLLK